MRAPFLAASAIVLCPACSNDDHAIKAYELTAFEAVGVQPDSPPPIVPYAREALPRVLPQCGIPDPKLVDASASAVVLRLALDARATHGGDCVRRSLPAGDNLEESVFPLFPTRPNIS